MWPPTNLQKRRCACFQAAYIFLSFSFEIEIHNTTSNQQWMNYKMLNLICSSQKRNYFMTLPTYLHNQTDISSRVTYQRHLRARLHLTKHLGPNKQTWLGESGYFVFSILLPLHGLMPQPSTIQYRQRII